VKRVLVIGDGCKDIFQYGKCERLSPEAPVPVFKPLQEKSNGGMAVNVYANLIALGIDCDIITDSGITKTRYIDEVSNQMLLRVDENDSVQQVSSIVVSNIKFDEYDAIVISDYNKGFLSKSDIFYISNRHHTVFLDTKKDIQSWCGDIFCIKINNKEYLENKTWIDTEFRNIAVVTLGDKGATYSYRAKKNKERLIPITEEHPVRDLTGAGDTFLASLVAKYLENENIEEAIQFANKCSAWAVTQKGVAVIDLKKII
jgi:D-beta-D-heptose 7-phosphate kinase/D-beta-D-heptose 1-phosphate adenosyltransferase